jgi:hypothetical protein
VLKSAQQLIKSMGGFALGISMLVSCDPGVESIASWPQGTVLAVDGEPLFASEIDEHIDALLAINSAFAKTERRRQILIHIGFPLAYARKHNAERRAAARAEANAWYAGFPGIESSASDQSQIAFNEPEIGNWDMLGMDVWLVARSLEPGQTSKVVELPGRFAVIRMLERDNNLRGGEELMKICLEEFVFVDALDQISDDLYLQGTLEIIDPAWNEVVPGAYKYKMRAEL